MAFLMLVAGNATMVSMINLVCLDLNSFNGFWNSLFNPVFFLSSRALSLFYSIQISSMTSRPIPPSQRSLSRNFADSTLHLLWLLVALPRSTSLSEARCALKVFFSFSNRADFPCLLLQLIKAGDGIIASNQSANRDEEVFPDPDTFDMHRKRGTEQALGYGWGPHRCVAECLARAELEIVFGKLLFPSISIKDIFAEYKTESCFLVRYLQRPCSKNCRISNLQFPSPRSNTRPPQRTSVLRSFPSSSK